MIKGIRELYIERRACIASNSRAMYTTNESFYSGINCTRNRNTVSHLSKDS